jgi:hypothetical protein
LSPSRATTEMPANVRTMVWSANVPNELATTSCITLSL